MLLGAIGRANICDWFLFYSWQLSNLVQLRLKPEIPRFGHQTLLDLDFDRGHRPSRASHHGSSIYPSGDLLAITILKFGVSKWVKRCLSSLHIWGYLSRSSQWGLHGLIKSYSLLLWNPLFRLQEKTNADARSSVMFCISPAFCKLLAGEKDFTGNAAWIDMMLTIINKGFSADSTLRECKNNLVVELMKEKQVDFLTKVRSWQQQVVNLHVCVTAHFQLENRHKYLASCAR